MAWNQGTPLAARLSAQQVRTPIDNARDWWRSLLRMRDLRYKLKRWAACVLLWIDEWDKTLWLGQLLLIRHGVDQAKISAFIERKREIQRAQERVLRFFGQLPDDVLHKVVSFCPHAACQFRRSLRNRLLRSRLPRGSRQYKQGNLKKCRGKLLSLILLQLLLLMMVRPVLGTMNC